MKKKVSLRHYPFFSWVRALKKGRNWSCPEAESRSKKSFGNTEKAYYIEKKRIRRNERDA